ncbi:MAG: ATP-binding protein, partial [Patescibacteria group bacterium]
DREVARLAQRLREAYSSLEERVRERTEEIAEAHSRDEALLESIGEGVLALDMSGKILLCNKSAEELLQWKRSDIVGSHFSSCLPLHSGDGRLLPQSEHLIERALREKCTVRTTPQRTYHCERNDGENFPLALTAMPFLIGMEMKGIVVTFRDITAEKRVDRMKSEFISLASHQLRTPLTAIGWYIELLQKETGEQLSDDQRDYIAQIIDSHHRMVMLVNSLLNVSRIELGRLKIDPEQTDILKLVEDTIKELRPQIEERKLQFTTRLPGKADAFVDGRLVQIVLENLLSNAIKYTPTTGSIELRLISDPEEMRFEVRDTGYGIPKHQQQHIFEKLFRADNVQKTDTVGTGLGLYIARFSVEAWGGKIWFESDEGHGTTFCFTVPRSMKKVEVAQKTVEYDALTPP